MRSGWESDDKKLKDSLQISPAKKLKWLQSMHELLLATADPQRREIFWKLRGIR